MRIALYDVDSKIPNLALMKLSHHHKELGDNIEFYSALFHNYYDTVYASKIFDFSDASGLSPDSMQIGGTGWDISVVLPSDIEALQPDYTLYGYEHSIGFTMRGCRFNCSFCVVPAKEGRPASNNTIEDIWIQRDSDFVMLLDNDFFGNPEWANRIAEIKKHNLRVSFSQGLNIRIITDKQAKALASVRFYNITGKNRQVYFAWDRLKDERLIDAGIERCINAGIKPYQMAFFVLIGYDTTPEEDMYRVMKIRNYGCDPFAMPYKQHDDYQRHFVRWVNHKAIFNSVRWEDYAVGAGEDFPA